MFLEFFIELGTINSDKDSALCTDINANIGDAILIPDKKALTLKMDVS